VHAPPPLLLDVVVEPEEPVLPDEPVVVLADGPLLVLPLFVPPPAPTTLDALDVVAWAPCPPPPVPLDEALTLLPHPMTASGARMPTRRTLEAPVDQVDRKIMSSLPH
jgi:hypothetical protein